ncbi:MULTISPECIES: MerR family transcriptional regulator [Ferrimonas]|uniref:MerR family transcriptional regulator n=1 Tax=Ferrimonas TaxID=44011 RepID=UPI0003FBE533|nr:MULTISPECIES: MerR family transcriptional regulator [Ferrimonas]USD37139.1 MerR family transcriptional regulator [Ferrimonas sp. SCSIO 43195]
MLTVSQLATRFGLSRTAVLYYERQGLLSPASRSGNGYRWYGDKEIARLEQILAYRSFGLPVAKLAPLLAQPDAANRQQTLQDQFTALEREIQVLRQQQRAIMTLLETPQLLQPQGLTKSRWTHIMQAAGMGEREMRNWHRQFERMEPQGHQQFLESLNIDEDEIRAIRQRSQD